MRIYATYSIAVATTVSRGKTLSENNTDKSPATAECGAAEVSPPVNQLDGKWRLTVSISTHRYNPQQVPNEAC